MLTGVVRTVAGIPICMRILFAEEKTA